MPAYQGTDGLDIILGSGGDDVVTEFGVGEDIVTTFGGNDTVTVVPDGEGLLEILPDIVIMGPGDDDHLIIDYRTVTNQLQVSELSLDLLEGGLGGSVSLGGLLSLTFLGVDRFSVYAGTSDDYFAAGGGDDFLSGGQGFDTLLGGEGDDQLNGGAGRDVLSGEEGADSIAGGSGDDTLDGGLDADNLNGGDGDDRLDGGLGHDVLGGGDGQDLLDAGDGNDRLNGGFGNDRLYAGAGDDDLQGAAGNDRLSAGAGNDVIEGAQGNDLITGGSGDDLFIFRGASGSDVITDFREGVNGGDVISFRSDLFSSFADVLAHTTNDGLGNCTIAKNGVSIFLEDVTRGRLAEDDFVFTAAASGRPASAQALVAADVADPLVLPVGFEAKAADDGAVVCPAGETWAVADDVFSGLSSFDGRDPHRMMESQPADWLV